jgi:AP-1 complex subunit beta-1
MGDLLGGMEGLLGGPVAPAVPPIPKTGVLRADQPGQGQKTGLEIQARVLRRDAQTVILELTFANRSAAPLNGWALQLNKNPMGYTSGALQCADCAPGATVEALVPLSRNPQMSSGQPLQAPMMLQAAVKTSMDIFYFNVPVDLSCVLDQSVVNQAAFMQAWAAMEPRQAGVVRRSQSKLVPDNVVSALTSNFLQHVFSSSNDQADSIYLAGACGSATFFALVALQKSGPLVQVAVRSELPAFAPLLVATVDRVLQLVPQQ